MSVMILGICGSPRKSATEFVLQEAFKVIETIPEIETCLVTLRGKKLNPCIHCNRCITNKSGRCLVFDDDVNEIIEKWKIANGYLIASPVYSMGITPLLNIVFSRLRPLRPTLLNEKHLQKPKVGGAITVGGTRHGGQETAAEIIINLFLSKGILAVGGGGAYNAGTIWSKDMGKEGAIADLTGMETVKTIALRVAQSAKYISKGFMLEENRDL